MILGKASFLLSAFLLVQCVASDVARWEVDSCRGCEIFAKRLDEKYGENVPAVDDIALDLAYTCEHPHDEVEQFCEAIQNKEYSFATAYVSVRPENPGKKTCTKMHICH
ncbi:hypothetical protein Ddc_17876 [Ditylenchus destructor]|nr:hypothetical protein Ddc_17876 [Ditylenchus destructor]